jgi:hypothetical protein
MAILDRLDAYHLVESFDVAAFADLGATTAPRIINTTPPTMHHASETRKFKWSIS